MYYSFRFKATENEYGINYACYTGGYNTRTNLYDVDCYRKGENVPCLTLYIPKSSHQKERKLILEMICK